MRYKLYYSDYHSHIWANEFEAETDDKAKEKANEIVHGLGYDDDTLYREIFIANTDEEAINIAKKSCYNFASYSPALFRKNNDGTLTQLDL